MRRKKAIAKILVIIMMLSIFQVSCNNKSTTIEDSNDMSQAIAKFLEVDKVELFTTKVVGRYNYVCFYYQGETEQESGYSYAAFRKKATGDFVLEFAQVPSKLIPMAEGIGGAYYDDHLILVSSNENLDMIKITGEIEEKVKVKNTPYIYVIDIFEKKDTGKKVSCSFYDKNGVEIK